MKSQIRSYARLYIGQNTYTVTIINRIDKTLYKICYSKSPRIKLLKSISKVFTLFIQKTIFESGL